MRIFHIAQVADWSDAERTGSYTVSTLGRSLDDEGFIHASRAEQVRGTYDAFYGGRDLELVLLTIDTDLLDVPWREDPVGDTTFPHLYGPLSPSAVVAVAAMPGALDALG
jgi:uncharacterized protein (DUF952 family)